MKTEYEVKIPNINTKTFEDTLSEVGAKKVILERVMRRNIYETNPPQEWVWIRLRYDWSHTTLTIKHVQAHTIDWTKELECIVQDFDIMHTMLITMGFVLLTYQENKRTSRRLDACDIEIDIRPNLEPYAEIEWPNQDTVALTVEKLWYRMQETTAVKVKQMYEAKGIDLHSIERLVFD